MGIYQRKNRGEDWYIDYYDAQGRRMRQKIGRSKKQAQAVLMKREVEVIENRHLDIKQLKKIRFKDFAGDYLELYAKPNKKSWEKTDKTILNRLMPPFGKRYLYEITPLMIERYREERLKTVCKATVNRELACLKVMYSKAVEWGKATENPVKKVKFFKEDNRRLRFLSKEEIQILLGHCSPKLRAIVEVALNTGMRKGEIQGLKWEDVDYVNEVIALMQTKNDEKRYCPLNLNIRKALASIKRHSESSYVFCGEDGKPFNFRKAFQTALKKSKIEDFRFHDLRHTFASHLAMSGVDLNTIRELLGHKSLEMTLRYSHLSQSHKNKAVALLGKNIVTNKSPEAVTPNTPSANVTATASN
ncbi:MAG: tyrosine-type recombinase/integrase [Candidatus Omnitrophota bacterium]